MSQNQYLIRLNHQGEDLGEYTLETAQTLYSRGLLPRGVFAWQPGDVKWRLLTEILPEIKTSSPVVSPPPVFTPTAKKRSLMSGRISRGEYILSLFIGLIVIVMTMTVFGWIVDAAAKPGENSDTAKGTLFLILWISYYFIICRKRLHDMDLTGWFAIFMIIPPFALILVFMKGTKGWNSYGMSPEHYKLQEKADAKRYLEEHGYYQK